MALERIWQVTYWLFLTVAGKKSESQWIKDFYEAPFKRMRMTVESNTEK
jgi:hypothetical protein